LVLPLSLGHATLDFSRCGDSLFQDLCTSSGNSSLLLTPFLLSYISLLRKMCLHYVISLSLLILLLIYKLVSFTWGVWAYIDICSFSIPVIFLSIGREEMIFLLTTKRYDAARRSLFVGVVFWYYYNLFIQMNKSI
jgi:hypothetical protein